jgi:hypothetical protein
MGSNRQIAIENMKTTTKKENKACKIPQNRTIKTVIKLDFVVV